MITRLSHLLQTTRGWFDIHPNLMTFLLIAPFFRPFGLSSFHVLWPIELIGNLWGILAFFYALALCWAINLRLGRSWWLMAFVCAITAISTLVSAWVDISSLPIFECIAQSNIIDVLGMTGQALGLAAAVCLCATQTSWYRLFSVLLYTIAAILLLNTALLLLAPAGILSMPFVGAWHRSDSPILLIGNRNFLYLWHLPLLASTCALDALYNLKPCPLMASPHTNQQQVKSLIELLDTPLPKPTVMSRLRWGVSLRTWLIAGAGLAAVNIADSQTTLGALALFTLLSLGILIYHHSAYRVFPRLLTALWSILSNPLVHLGVYLTVSGGFVLFRLQNHQPFTFLINNLMGRSTTLTYRTEIWDATMNLIDTPSYAAVIGHGHLSGKGMVQFFMTHGYEEGYHVTEWVHVHNDLLQTLFSAGWLGIIASIIALIWALYAVKRLRSVAFMAIIGATICAFMVVMITETFMGSPVVTFMVIASFLFAQSTQVASPTYSAT